MELLLRNNVDSIFVGPENILSFVLRTCSTVLATAVSSLFQQIKNSSIWPCEVKHCVVGTTNDVKNYCSISILYKISLFSDCLLLDFTYPKVKSRVSPRQHGFMNHRSTSSQLVHCIQLLCNRLDKNTPCVTVHGDIIKSFYSVLHDRLLEKLTVIDLDEKFLVLFKS